MMRLILCFIIVYSPFVAIGQNKTSKLQKRRLVIEGIIQKYQDSLDILDRLIQKQFVDDLQQKKSIDVVMASNSVVKAGSDFSTDNVGSFSAGDTIKAYYSEMNQIFVTKGNISGFISDYSLVKTPEVKGALQIWQDQDIEARSAKRRQGNEVIVKKSAAEKRSMIKEAYPQIDAGTLERLVRGEYWIGMSSEYAKISLGNPNRINSTVNARGGNEQWVYFRLNLYFDDGILTSYQKSN
jgi:hypothetical protein